jgi:hypothetical protein
MVETLGFKKKLAFYLIGALASLAVSLALGELFVRLASHTPYPTPAAKRKNSLQFVSSIFARHLFAQRQQMVKGGRDLWWYINEKGYRGRDFSWNKPQGTIRIIFYGGSAVFDKHTSLGHHWPRRVEYLLQKSGFPVEVINAGVPGHASFDSVGRLFAEGHLLEPDIVVLYNAWNDIKYFRSEEPLLRQFRPYEPETDPRITYQGTLDRLLSEYSQLYLRLRDRYYTWKLRIGPEGAKPPGPHASEIGQVGPRQFRLNVEMFVDLARNIGAYPVLMTQARLVSRQNSPRQRRRIAYHYQLLTHEALCEAFEKTDQIIRQVAARKKVLLIDASKHMTGKDQFFVDHVHLTNMGSLQLAYITASSLTPLVEKLAKKQAEAQKDM